MCDGKNDCPLTETSSGGEDEEGCAEGSGQVGDHDDDGGGGDGGGGGGGRGSAYFAKKPIFLFSSPVFYMLTSKMICSDFRYGVQN